MTVIVLNNASSYFRGSLAQYLLEIRANVFVGNLNAKVRETLWQQILVECRKEGQNIKPEAILLYSTNTEQGFHMKMEGVPYRHVRTIDSQRHPRRSLPVLHRQERQSIRSHRYR